MEPFFRRLREYTAAGDIKLDSLEFEYKIWEVNDVEDVIAEEEHRYYLVISLPNLSNINTLQYKEAGGWPEGWPELGKELWDAVEDYVLFGGPEIWGLYTHPGLKGIFFEEVDDLIEEIDETLDVEDLK